MRFRIDVYTATSTAAVGGPITEVLGVSISEKLNQIGEASITLPAHVASSRGLARGYKYSIYSEELGYLGQFRHIESSLDAAAETITIKAYDSLISLAERVAGFRRSVSDTPFNTAASMFFATPGWTVSYEDGVAITDKITFSVEGENYLRVADYLRQYVRGWFRREGDTEIKFGKFTTTTPELTFVAFNPTLGTIPSSQALITGLARTRQGGEVANRIYAVGGGVGETKIDLRYATRAATTSTPYSVTSSTIGTGVAGYYIEDTSSQATYGQIDRVIAWNEIRPITNSLADLQNAGNALYDIAAAYLKKYKSENDAYSLTAVGVPTSLKVGDLVRVVYNGVAELETGSVGWINVANNFYVTDITRSFDAGGGQTATVGIAANGEAVVGDTEVLYDILQDVQTLKLRTQPTQTYFSKSYDTVIFQNGIQEAPSFNVRFGPEVLAVNELYCEINIRPIVYPSISVAATVSSANAFSSTSGQIATFTGNTPLLSVAMSTAAAHSHDFNVEGSSSGTAGTVVYANDGSTNLKRGNSGTIIYSTTSTGAHRHTLDQHQHAIDHTHSLTSQGGHTHGITVTSSLGGSTGVVQSKTTKPQILLSNIDLPNPPYFVLSTGASGNTTLMQNSGSETGSIVNVTVGASTVTAIEGFTAARINLMGPTTNYVDLLGMRNAYTRFDVYNYNLVPCSVHIQWYGRVTIQPIAV